MNTTAPPTSSRWLALVTLCAGMLMIILDQTIVNVALPSIQGDLGFSDTSLAWVVNSYLIAFAGLLLLAGRLGDLLGRKRVFLAGLVVFTAASLVCGVATSQEMLVVARFVQGAGGALTSSVILGVIVTLFPEAEDRAKAIGVYAFVASAGGALGLLLGGVLTEALSWHWIFFVNLPIGVLSGLFAVRVLETDRGLGLRHGADVAGAALVTSALMLGVYTIVETSAYGWGSARTVGFGLLSLGLLAAFVVRQAMATNPLLPLRLLRSRNIAGANLVQALMVQGLFGMFFLGALFMQRVLDYGPTQVGLAFLPVALAIGVLSLGVSARLTTRFGGRAVLMPGLLAIIIGLVWLNRAPVDATYTVDLLPSILLMGVGAGLSFTPLMTLAMSGATPRDSGVVSGLVNTTQQVGGALGLAVLATLAASRTESELSNGAGQAAALTGGYEYAFVVAAIVAAVALVLTATVLRSESDAVLEADEELVAENAA